MVRGKKQTSEVDEGKKQTLEVDEGKKQTSERWAKSIQKPIVVI